MWIGRFGIYPGYSLYEGRFADRAHFTRGMKSMFGVTPAAVQQLLRTHGGVDPG